MTNLLISAGVLVVSLFGFAAFVKISNMKKLIILCLVISFAACKPSASTNNTAPAKADQSKIVYTCSMHPEIKVNKPGVCPKCGMDLIPN